MAENSKTEWTHHTFNPWRECTKISAGYENCYAETLSHRSPGTLGIWGDGGTRVVASEAMWKEPLKWNRKADCCCGAAGLGPTSCEFCAGGSKRPRVFCASLADVFEDWGGECHDSDGCAHYTSDTDPNVMVRNGDLNGMSSDGLHYTTLCDVRRRLFALIDATPSLDWLVLTKRPENIAKMMPKRLVKDKRPIFPGCPGPLGEPIDCMVEGGTRKNLWLGITAEKQEQANNRLPHIVQVPAAVRFVSYEPALGPLSIDRRFIEPIQGTSQHGQRFIDWIICGCESGHHRRPMKTEWAESLRDQCKAAGVAFFMKQMEINGKVETDIAKFPAGLRVREFPEASK